MPRRVGLFLANAYFAILLLSGAFWTMLFVLFGFGFWDPTTVCHCEEVVAAFERIDWDGSGDALHIRVTGPSIDDPGGALEVSSESAVPQSLPTFFLPLDVWRAPTGPHYDVPAEKIGERLVALGAREEPAESDRYRGFRFEQTTIQVIRHNGVEVRVTAPDAPTALAAAGTLGDALGAEDPRRPAWVEPLLSNLLRLFIPAAWFTWRGLKKRLEGTEPVSVPG